MSVRGPLLRLVLALTASACALPIIGAGAERRTASPLPPAAAARALPTDRETCYRELAAAGVAFSSVPAREAHGVQMPARLHGPLAGVALQSRNPGSVHEVIDCRLVLTLLSWMPSLRRAGVTRLEHYSIYRPGARVNGRGRVSGHARGLAIDAARFHLEGGSVLDVASHWEERDRGGEPCPPRPSEAEPSRLLRSLLCEAVDQNLFQVVLTPHHDRAHADHLHLELRPEVAWTYVR